MQGLAAGSASSGGSSKACCSCSSSSTSPSVRGLSAAASTSETGFSNVYVLPLSTKEVLRSSAAAAREPRPTLGVGPRRRQVQGPPREAAADDVAGVTGAGAGAGSGAVAGAEPSLVSSLTIDEAEL